MNSIDKIQDLFDEVDELANDIVIDEDVESIDIICARACELLINMHEKADNAIETLRTYLENRR